MAEKTTFIKVDRNILDWRWYKDTNTKVLFLHLLLKANIKPHGFETATIKRGEIATSYASLAEETGLSVKSVRTALNHLKMTGEVAVKRHPHFSVISILEYDRYQSQVAVKGQGAGKARAVNGQQSKNDKKGINTQERENPARAGTVPLSVGEVSTFVSEEGLAVDPEAFFNYYEAVGWTVKDKPVRNWKALCRTWNGKPDYKQKPDRQAAIDEVTRRWLEQ